MSEEIIKSIRRTTAAVVSAGAILIAPAAAVADYHPITPDAGAKVITLTGHDLTIEQLIEIARHGAQVKYSADAIRHAAPAWSGNVQLALTPST
jgi:histidine ammonia-lyase